MSHDAYLQRPFVGVNWPRLLVPHLRIRKNGESLPPPLKITRRRDVPREGIDSGIIQELALISDGSNQSSLGFLRSTPRPQSLRHCNQLSNFQVDATISIHTVQYVQYAYLPKPGTSKPWGFRT
jgi:hypothetical protein